MSSQIIPLKARADFQNPVELLTSIVEDAGAGGSAVPDGIGGSTDKELHKACQYWGRVFALNEHCILV
jgi:hypothetical protein